MSLCRTVSLHCGLFVSSFMDRIIQIICILKTVVICQELKRTVGTVLWWVLSLYKYFLIYGKFFDKKLRKSIPQHSCKSFSRIQFISLYLLCLLIQIIVHVVLCDCATEILS